ncbi:MAG TPA: hypothetical protein DC049_01740, partial [Spirochaetia bacterium]|nr:hypothetical protein [Spirochaetia bacterium]
MPTQFEIAGQLQVSRQTVSHALNNRKGVNPDTCRKVLKLVNDLDYQHDFFALSMRNKSSNFIGNIYLQHSLKLRELIYSIRELFFSQDYNCIDLFVNYNSANEKLAKLLYSNLFCGFIINSNDPSVKIVGKTIEEIITKIGKPAVFFGSNCDFLSGTGHTSVISNISQGYENIIKLLYGKGCRKMAYTGIDSVYNKNKLDIIRKISKNLGCKITENRLFLSKDRGASYKTGQDAARCLPLGEIDAVICANDLNAAGFINEAFKKGVRIPED